MPSITVRVSEEIAAEIDALAATMDRTRTWVVSDALSRYLEDERQWLAEVRAGLEELDRGEGIPHESAMAETRALLDRRKASG
jgi:predicted transcriptional regulator